jgi:hypothetical protein
MLTEDNEFEAQIATCAKELADLTEDRLNYLLNEFSNKSYAQGSIYFQLATWYIGCVLVMAENVSKKILTPELREKIANDVKEAGLMASTRIKTFQYN